VLKAASAYLKVKSPYFYVGQHIHASWSVGRDSNWVLPEHTEGMLGSIQSQGVVCSVFLSDA
jgi:hypothetical protein